MDSFTPRSTRGELHASVGDRLVVRHEDGSPPYLVRWADTGHVSLVFPGAEAFVQEFHPGAGIEPD
jgi:hypothetical protein